MKVITATQALRRLVFELRSTGRSVGFVPTMGGLHEGHVSLIRRAQSHCAGCAVITSIFVNPEQFDDPNDYATYPRTLEHDYALLEAAAVDYVFVPEKEEIYPAASLGRPFIRTSVKAGSMAEGFCGSSRPGHFDGVVNVVSILFNIVGPDFAVFGEKDFQQLKVIEQLTRDMRFPVEIVSSPVVREIDGLAMSSRNMRLTPEQRMRARGLSLGLSRAVEAAADAKLSINALKDVIRSSLAEHEIRLDYVEIVNSSTLNPARSREGDLRILAAAYVDSIRLIDTMSLSAAVDPKV